MTVCKLDAHEQQVLDNAKYFTVVVFRGRGVYDRVERPTREDARLQAKEMSLTTSRGVMVYAVDGPHQALIETVFSGEDIMTTFILVTHKANFTKPVVTSYADDAALKAAEAALKSGTEYLVFTGNNEELNELKVEEIVKLFNAIAPKGAAKTDEFHDRAAAETALAARLVEVAKAPKAAGAPRGKQPGPLNLASKVTPVRAGSSLHKLLDALVPGTNKIDAIAKHADIRDDQAKHRIKFVLATKHGIGHTVSADGVYSIAYPAGHTHETLVKHPEPPKADTAKEAKAKEKADKAAAEKAEKAAKIAADKEAAAKAKAEKAAKAATDKAAKAAAKKAAPAEGASA